MDVYVYMILDVFMSVCMYTCMYVCLYVSGCLYYCTPVCVSVRPSIRGGRGRSHWLHSIQEASCSCSDLQTPCKKASERARKCKITKHWCRNRLRVVPRILNVRLFMSFLRMALYRRAAVDSGSVSTGAGLGRAQGTQVTKVSHG